MKKLITLLAGVVLAASLTTAAYAQAAGPAGGGVQGAGQDQKQHGKHPGMVGMKLLRQLDLSPDQQKQVRDLMKKMRAKREADKKDGDKVDRKEAMATRKQFMEDIEKILTTEQKDKLKKLQAEARDKAKDKSKDNVRKGKKGKNGAGKAGGGTTGGGAAGGSSKTNGGGG